MKNLLGQSLKYVLFLSLAIALTFFALQSISPEDIKKTWEGANKLPILLSGVAVMLSHFFRALRWKLMLNPMGYKFSTWHSYLSILTGYGANILIPRGGELGRCLVLNRLGDVPVKKSLGTVISERVIDLLMLFMMMGLAFIFEFDKLLSIIVDFLAKNDGAEGETDYTKLIILGVIAIGSIIVFIWGATSKQRKVLKLRVKLKAFVLGLLEGLKSVFNLEHNVLFLFYSFLIWFLYYLMAYFVVLAFPETQHLGLEGALMILVLGSIAMAMPTPGGTGSYHVFVPFGLEKLYKIAVPIGVTFATIFHAWQTLVHFVIGGASLILSLVLIANGKNRR